MKNLTSSTRVLQVFHHDSPGIRVYVKRGWFKRRFFNPNFSHVGERHLNPKELEDIEQQALELAREFHELYEWIAPSMGYTTRTDTRQFDPESPNGRTMVAVCFDLLTDRRGLEQRVANHLN